MKTCSVVLTFQFLNEYIWRNQSNETSLAVLYQGVPLCAAVKGMVFMQFSLGWGMEIIEFWSRFGYYLPEN